MPKISLMTEKKRLDTELAARDALIGMDDCNEDLNHDEDDGDSMSRGYENGSHAGDGPLNQSQDSEIIANHVEGISQRFSTQVSTIGQPMNQSMNVNGGP